ncbi:hypothetical protein DL95DRAFT_454412 [Leptodontidium sp. 2 PMI_412]|nr:hypothetical protein DL95DRAFT_454412 [Leptodontidium sp. 2 PMI_412]
MQSISRKHTDAVFLLSEVDHMLPLIEFHVAGQSIIHHFPCNVNRQTDTDFADRAPCTSIIHGAGAPWLALVPRSRRPEIPKTWVTLNDWAQRRVGKRVTVCTTSSIGGLPNEEEMKASAVCNMFGGSFSQQRTLPDSSSRTHGERYRGTRSSAPPCCSQLIIAICIGNLDLLEQAPHRCRRRSMLYKSGPDMQQTLYSTELIHKEAPAPAPANRSVGACLA